MPETWIGVLVMSRLNRPFMRESRAELQRGGVKSRVRYGRFKFRNGTHEQGWMLQVPMGEGAKAPRILKID
ncbi:MAG: hypothetical protein KGI26_07095 [Thaumarchaeota archaeon]|nr:hypothetical protein [Nitrososphaerota archaeon]